MPEQVKAFLKKMGEDKGLRKKVKETYQDSLVKVANDAGFKFTRKDLEAALSEILAEELKKVTGGYHFCPYYPSSGS